MRQKSIRQDHLSAACETQKLAWKLDGMDFGEIMSELSRRRVLILGRFSERRLAVLESIKAHLKAQPNKYIPELFTFEKPESTSLTEAIIGFAALSRFIIEPRSVRTPGDRAEFPVRSGGAFDQPDRQGVCALYQPANLQERCESHGALSRSGRLAGEDGPAGRASGGEETLKDLSRERKVVIRPGRLDAGGGRGISAAARRAKSSQFEEPPKSRVRAPGSASDSSAAASIAAAALWKDAGRGDGHGSQTLDAAASSHAR